MYYPINLDKIKNKDREDVNTRENINNKRQ